MKKLCCENSLEGCEAIKAIVEAAGIPCVIRNEATASLFGRQAGFEWPEVWVVNDEQFDQAWALLNRPVEESDRFEATDTETETDSGKEP